MNITEYFNKLREHLKEVEAEADAIQMAAYDKGITLELQKFDQVGMAIHNIGFALVAPVPLHMDGQLVHCQYQATRKLHCYIFNLVTSISKPFET